MKNFTKLLLLSSILLVAVTFRSSAQSILNPADPVITYNPSSPPVEPPFGTIGKWVRTVRMWWNTDAYKAYIYKGVAFRLKYPKSYNPSAPDGKKYPMLIFFHGLGEASPITDNEFHLLWGAEYFAQSVENGTYDGYVLMMQSQGFWGGGHYAFAKELAEYMITNNKLDPFRTTVNGLSSGGQGTWEMYLNNTNFIVGAIPMSSCAFYYRSIETVNKVKFTPFWNAHGGLDGSPSPYTCYEVRDSMLAAGANYKNIMYPNKGHDTWNETFAEPEFWPFLSKAYASNPWTLYGKTDFNGTEPINVTIGLPPGYDAYEWRKNGVLISGATTNSINVTQTGVYDARVRRGATLWSNWSKQPVPINRITDSTPVTNIHIEAENYTAMSGIQTEPTQDVGGGLNVAWQDVGDWMDYSVNIPTTGTYQLKFRIASQFANSQVQVRNASGDLISAVVVPNTGYFQTWQTASASGFFLAGQQTVRIYTTVTSGGWNFNWWEIKSGTGTAPPPANVPPTANAGSPQSITLPTSSVTLTGSGTDTDGTITTYAWSQVSGPAAATFGTPAAATTTANNLVQGSYVFRLTVTDNSSATATSDVTITVNAAPSGGPALRIQAENYSAMFGIRTESTSDAGGGLNVAWQDTGDWMDYLVNIDSAGSKTVNFRIATQFTGPQFQLRKSDGTVLATLNVPNTGSFQNWQTISAVVTLPAGSQTLRIHTTQASGGWNINWWEIVGGGSVPPPPPVNNPPTANAGPNQTITLPTSSVSLSGSGIDTDGTITGYAWSKISGPAGSAFSSPSTAATNVTGLVEGTHVFRLTVTDNGGATGFSNVTITVNPVSTTPPNTIHIEAESYTVMNGIRTESTADAGGGLNVAWIDTNDWMDYSVNVPSIGVYTVRFRVATEKNGPPQLQLRKSDGTVLATVNVPNTGGFQNWQTVTATVSLTAGQQTLRIFCNNASGGYNVNWWELIPPSTGPTASPDITRSAISEPQVNDITNEAVSVYPNPVQSTISLVVNNELTGRMNIELVNAAGARVKAYRIEKPTTGIFRTTLQIGNLQQGSYFLRVNMNDWTDGKKLLKQ